jgi:hypothetical protein
MNLKLQHQNETLILRTGTLSGILPLSLADAAKSSG